MQEKPLDRPHTGRGRYHTDDPEYFKLSPEGRKKYYDSNYRKTEKYKIYMAKYQEEYKLGMRRKTKHVDSEDDVINRKASELKARKIKYQNRDKVERRHKDKVKHLRRVYGITREKYDEMVKQQNNLCAICKKPDDVLDRELCVDHDHKTNKIRGLLCTHCNTGLGQFKDSITMLETAVDYLKAHQEVQKVDEK